MIQFQYVAHGGHQLAVSVDLPGGSGAAAPPGGWPVVIVVHGLTGQRLGRSYHLVEFGRLLGERGIACVRFDQAGCGESTGRFEDLTLNTIAADTRAVHRWAATQPWADAGRVGLTGLSLGGLAAVDADAELPTRALALWAPVYDMPRVFTATTQTGLRAVLEHQGWVPYRGLRVGRGFVETLDALDAGVLLARSGSPILLVHADTDAVVGVGESDAYEARCAELGRPCRRLHMPSADHDFSAYHDRQCVLGETVGFFAEHLGAGAAAARGA